MTVAQIDKNCVKRDTIDRIGEEFQDLQVDFFEEKTQKKKVPSLVCCWDPREDSRTRTKLVTGKLKTRRHCKMNLQSLYTEPTTAMTTEENPINTCDENM